MWINCFKLRWFEGMGVSGKTGGPRPHLGRPARGGIATPRLRYRKKRFFEGITVLSGLEGRPSQGYAALGCVEWNLYHKFYL